MKKVLLATSVLTLAVSSLLANAADQAVIDRYNKTCGICHNSGTAGAPKTGDVAAWKPRLDKGMDTLVTSVEKGINAMPPKGMCFDCSSDEFKALIEYMATPK